jgi:hypothetical protein
MSRTKVKVIDTQYLHPSSKPFAGCHDDEPKAGSAG